MELIQASNFPTAIKSKACEIFRLSRRRPRDINRKKYAAYCTYVAYLENGEHISIDTITQEYGISMQDLRTMVSKGGKMVSKYVPPNVFANAGDILPTFLIRVGLNEELVQVLQPWIDYLYSFEHVKAICPWDVCYALVTKYIQHSGANCNIDSFITTVKDREGMNYVKNLFDFLVATSYSSNTYCIQS